MNKKEKIKYVALSDEYVECPPDHFGFKESEFDKGCEIIEDAISLWNNKSDLKDAYELLYQESENCDIFKFYNTKKELLCTLPSDTSEEEIEEKLEVLLEDHRFYIFEDDILDDGKLAYSIALLENADYDGFEGLLSLIEQMLRMNNISTYSICVDRTIYY